MPILHQSEVSPVNDAFELCQEALYGPGQNSLLVHMWEHHQGNDVTRESETQRRDEVASVLGVMANCASALYDDTGYLLPTGFKSRAVSGERHDGFATLATSVITKHAPDIWSGTTGLLLLNPPAVFAAPTDAWSLFYEQALHLPGSEEWHAMMRHQVVQDLCPARDLLVRDAGARAAMSGNLAVTAWKPAELSTKSSLLWERLVAEQLPGSYAGIDGVEGMFIDPFSVDARERASRALHEMIVHETDIREEFGGRDIWSEVCVIAGMQHVVGILIRNDEAPFESGPTDWVSELSSRPQLRIGLLRAVAELQMVHEHQPDNTVQPAAVIYQPGNTAVPLVHFSQTDAHIQQLVCV